jgi:hypothetical protein
MIGDLDRTLRELLRQTLGLGEAQIRFDRPDGRLADSARSSPTVCLYLYDIRENRELRRADVTVERRGDGTAELRPPALRFDLSYLVTAWASDVEQEHELLGKVLTVLLAHPVLEPSLLQGELHEQELPIPTSVGQPDGLVDAGTLWNGLGGVRPALFYNVTVPVSPFLPEERRLVAARLVRVTEKQRDEPAPVETRRPEESVEFAGKVLGRDGQPVRDAQVSLREVSRSAVVGPDGVYRIGRLVPGVYTLVASAPGFREVRREVLLTDRAGLGRLSRGYDVRLEPV